MTQKDYTTGKIAEYIWLVLAIASLCFAIFEGAYWHIATAFVCGLLWLVHRLENIAAKDIIEKQNGRTEK